MSSLPSPSLDKSKKQRRKHKNSKLGCLQCKERRMKCNEELPECRNCRIRQVKIPCSYLSLTETEKNEFRSIKLKQAAAYDANNALPSPTSNPTSNSPSSNSPVTIPLVKHVKLELLESQRTSFFEETPQSVVGRLFFSKMINDSFFNFSESFNSHFTLTATWLALQMTKRLEALDADDEPYRQAITTVEQIAIRSKSDTINYLRRWVLKLIEAQGQADFRACAYYFSQMTIPTICLQGGDVWTQRDIRGFYISGSMLALNELYQRTPDRSPAAVFIAKGFVATTNSLFIPNYTYTVLEEILEVLKSFSEHVNNTEDDLLIHHCYNLLNFFEEELSQTDLEKNFDPKKVATFPAKMLYSIYFKFSQIVPSEIYTIPSCSDPVHRTFYLLLYTVARVLDNVFPESRYITKFRFIGPTTMYPFTNDDVIADLPQELVEYVNYGRRLLAFFTRRSDLFGKYMQIQDYFPESLSENRMRSRKVKVKEDFITKFKTTLIKPNNYPQVREDSSVSPSSQSSFSLNFHTTYALSFELNDMMSLDPRQLETTIPDFNEKLDLDKVAKSGLLMKDYDPLNDDIQECKTETTPVSLQKCVEDHTELMKSFIE